MAARSWHLVIYIGDGPSSRLALESARSLCDEHLKGRCTLEVIDINENPELAYKHNILILPTLVRRLPLPVMKLVGASPDLDLLARALDIK